MACQYVDMQYQINLHHFPPFQNVYLEKIFQGHRVELLQQCHSMANINVYKSPVLHLCSHPFQDIIISNFLP